MISKFNLGNEIVIDLNAVVGYSIKEKSYTEGCLWWKKRVYFTELKILIGGHSAEFVALHTDKEDMNVIEDFVAAVSKPQVVYGGRYGYAMPQGSV